MSKKLIGKVTTLRVTDSDDGTLEKGLLATSKADVDYNFVKSRLDTRKSDL